MAKRSLFQHLRDAALFAAAFAMVLFVILADHRDVRPNVDIASAGQAVVVGDGLFTDRPADSRIAAVETEAAAR